MAGPTAGGERVSDEPTWYDQARCAGYPPEMFFGFTAERPQRKERRERLALEVCAECPVRAECRDAGREEPFGIWGGTTSEERGFHPISGHRVGSGRSGPTKGFRDHIIEHGTVGGYSKHRRLGESPCQACRAAHAARHLENKARRRENGVQCSDCGHILADEHGLATHRALRHRSVAA